MRTNTSTNCITKSDMYIYSLQSNNFLCLYNSFLNEYKFCRNINLWCQFKGLCYILAIFFLLGGEGSSRSSLKYELELCSVQKLNLAGLGRNGHNLYYIFLYLINANSLTSQVISIISHLTYNSSFRIWLSLGHYHYSNPVTIRHRRVFSSRTLPFTSHHNWLHLDIIDCHNHPYHLRIHLHIIVTAKMTMYMWLHLDLSRLHR